jgi:hypothetical protein
MRTLAKQTKNPQIKTISISKTTSVYLSEVLYSV